MQELRQQVMEPADRKPCDLPLAERRARPGIHSLESEHLGSCSFHILLKETERAPAYAAARLRAFSLTFLAIPTCLTEERLCVNKHNSTLFLHHSPIYQLHLSELDCLRHCCLRVLYTQSNIIPAVRMSCSYLSHSILYTMPLLTFLKYQAGYFTQ